MDDTELPDEYLRELGRIVVAWNKLESHLNHTLVLAVIESASGYKRAVAAFVHVNFPQKLDALAAMLLEIEEDFAKLYADEVAGKLRAAQKIRNKALHQFWYAHEGAVYRSDIQARGEIKLSNIPIPIQELREGVIVIEEAFECLFFISIPLSHKFQPHKGQ